jgi:hypothetical protein
MSKQLKKYNSYFKLKVDLEYILEGLTILQKYNKFIFSKENL